MSGTTAVDDLLAGFSSDESALLLSVLRREDEAGATPQVRRTPTDAELIAAGWKSPPPPPPTKTELLQDLRDAHREIGPRQWVLYGPVEDDVLLDLHEHEPGRLRHKITKRWGHMWRLAKPERNRETTT